MTLFGRLPGPLPKHLDQAFAAFWEAYPPRRPNPRRKAETVFARLVRDGVEADALARAALRFAAECREKRLEGEFIPHAATWLGQRRDLDYPDPVATPPDPALEGHPLWSLFRGALAAAEFRAWIAPCLAARSEDRLVLTPPSAWAAAWMNEHLLGRLRAATDLSVLIEPPPRPARAPGRGQDTTQTHRLAGPEGRQ